MVLASLINIIDGSNAMRLVKGVWKKMPQLKIESQTPCFNLVDYTSNMSLIIKEWAGYRQREFIQSQYNKDKRLSRATVYIGLW